MPLEPTGEDGVIVVISVVGVPGGVIVTVLPSSSVVTDGDGVGVVVPMGVVMGGDVGGGVFESQVGGGALYL